MRVGLINFHFVHNYGAVLECVALKKHIESLGHNVTVIDYRPDYMEQQFAVFPSPIKFAKWAQKDYANSSKLYRFYRMLRRAVQALYRYKTIKIRKNRMAAFEPFIQKNMNLTKRYHTLNDLQKNPPECDVYISGSDQIWNPYVTAGIDPAYFLTYGSVTTKRIAYAVSPCQLNVKEYSSNLKKYLANYDAISLRERELCDELEMIYNKKIEVCIDPTLLLSADDYSKIEEPPKKMPQDYILVYGFIDRDNPELLGKCASYISKETGMKIIDISLDTVSFPSPVIHLDALTPGEFLSYIKNAEYIVTNSFHGTVFSAIYRKSFWSVEKYSTASRMTEFMNKIGLADRLVTEFRESIIDRAIKIKPDYKFLDETLACLKEQTNRFLTKVLK